MLRPPPFPIRLDELTPAILSEGIGASIVDFTAQRIGADRGMLGEIFLIDLAYAPDSHGPERVVAKFAALRDASLASAVRGRAHERELRCFEELLSTTPATTPANYGTWYDPETAHFLLLQGAVDVDEQVDQIVGLSPDDARLVLREMARLHGRWWNDPHIAELDWLPGLDGDGRISNMTTLAAQGWGPLCELMANEMSTAEQALGSELPDRIAAAFRLLAAMPSTLIHGDLRADNLLFSPDHATVTLIDWQGCGTGPPAFDLAYFLSQSLTTETRRQCEDELLEFYRSELRDSGIIVSAEQVRTGYAESMLYGLVIACAIPIISDPALPRVRTLASTIARRSLDAISDHDQLW